MPSFHVLPVSACVVFVFSSYLPQSKNTHVRSIEFSIDLTCEWLLVQGVTLQMTYDSLEEAPADLCDPDLRNKWV